MLGVKKCKCLSVFSQILVDFQWRQNHGFHQNANFSAIAAGIKDLEYDSDRWGPYLSGAYQEYCLSLVQPEKSAF